LILGCISPLAAQNPGSNRNFEAKRARIVRSAALPNSYDVPPQQRVQGEVSGKPPVLTEKDLTALETQRKTARSVHRADGFDVLGKPTPQRRMVAATPGQQRYEVSVDSLQKGLALVASLYRETGRSR
jgi:hypothetical protein